MVQARSEVETPRARVMPEAPRVEAREVRETRVEEAREVSFDEPVRETEVRANAEINVEQNDDRTSNLINTIRQAASKYEGARPEQRNSVPSQGATASRAAQPNRAKSIAERLGFINFDEDELDTPSYLRKEDSSEQTKSNGSSRPLDV